MSITMKDIAIKAGVSRPAVSAVLNGTTGSKVSEKTRARILKISKELNYRRNFVATALKTKKTGLLGFICGRLHVPFFSKLTMDMIETAEKHGYKLMVAVMPSDNKIDMEYFDKVLSGMCEGVFMSREIKFEHDILQDKINSADMPFVMLGSEFDSMSSVTFDYQTGMEKAFDELLENGHRKIAFAGHSSNIHKVDAYQKCCKIHQIEPVDYSADLDPGFNGMIECGREIAANLNRQTALITTDLSITVMTQEMDAAGIQIPDDLSVIVFNDTVHSRFFRPPLTSLSQNTKLMAKYGLDIMLDLINNKNSGKIRTVTIPPELIKRKSVKQFKKMEG